MINIHNLGADDEDVEEPVNTPVETKESHKDPETKEIEILSEPKVKGTKHQIKFVTKQDIRTGLWNTTLSINEKSFPAVNHKEPLSKIDEKRDKEHFLTKISNMLGLTHKACQILMYTVSEEAVKNREFEASLKLYKEEKDRKDKSARLAAEEAEANQPKKERPKIQGCFFPANYEYYTDASHHICGEIVQQFYDSEGNLIESPVCKCLTMVMGFPKSHDSDKVLIELQFTKYDAQRKKPEWKKIIVPIEAITTKDAFKKYVIAQGFLVQEININSTIDYLVECITANAGKEDQGSAFRSIDVTEITGWTDSTFTAFKLGGRTIRDVNGTAVSEEATCTNDELVEKLTVKGTHQKYIEVIRPLIHYERMRYGMYDAMASLLLRILGISPHTGMIIYPTSQGKTTVLQLIASIFGNPDEWGEGLLYSGDGSITGINAILHMYRDLPVLLDESTNSSEKLRKGITYLVGNGAAPVRGKGGGELRERQNHRSNVYMAAEESMMPAGTNDGSNTRMLPFYERFVPEGNGKMVEDAKVGMTQNFGHVIEPFLGKIFLNRAGLLAYFENAKARIVAKSTEDRVKRQAATFAAAQLSGLMLEQVLAEMGLKDPMNPEDVVDKMWNECVGNAEEPMAMKALRLFHSWFLREFNTSGLLHDSKTQQYYNEKRVLISTTVHKGKLCMWDEETWKDFLAEDFNKELLAKGFTNVNGIYKYWRDVLDILEYETIEKGGKTIKRTTTRVYHYKSIDSEKREQFHVVRIITDKMNKVLGLEGIEEPIEPANESISTGSEPKQEITDEQADKICEEYGFPAKTTDVFDDFDSEHEYVPHKLLRHH